MLQHQNISKHDTGSVDGCIGMPVIRQHKLLQQ